MRSLMSLDAFSNVALSNVARFCFLARSLFRVLSVECAYVGALA